MVSDSDSKKITLYSPGFSGYSEMDQVMIDEYQKKLDGLPESLFDLLFGGAAPDFISKLVEEYDLSEKQGAGIAVTIRWLVLGNIEGGGFDLALVKNCQIDPVLAKKFANLIFENVLRNYSQYLPDLSQNQNRDQTTNNTSDNILDLRLKQ